MTVNEFITATTRLENYYEKKYSTEQLKIMYEELKDLDVERYKNIIVSVLRKSKFLPKIVDIIELNHELPRVRKEHEDIANCKRCNNTGWIIYKKNGMDYAARCGCGHAQKYEGKKYYTPSYDEIANHIPSV